MAQGLNLTLFPPQSSWAPPRELPNLSGVRTLGIDVETKDPLLLERGPGTFRKDGFLAGVSISTADKSWYFPLRHMMGGNIKNIPGFLTWLRDVAKTERQWVGANLQYELEWLETEKVYLKGKFIDVQLCQALIDEEQESNALDVLCRQYLGTPKDEALLRRAAMEFGCDPKSELWKLHSKYVGPYAEFDSASPLLIFKQQWPEIQKQKLEEIFTLESKVLPLLWLMRKQGVRVDLDRAAKLSKTFLTSENNLRLKIKHEYGADLDEWSGQEIARVCDRLKVSYPMTAKGNPSFVGDWMDHQDHPFLKTVSELRELNRLRQTFIEDWIFKNEIDGVVHCQWKQLVADDGGTRTGRMAASNPNPQQVPARSELAPQIRALFVPMDPRQHWCKIDYSQQEPRLLVHFAMLCKFRGAKEIGEAYKKDPKMDFYQFLVDAAGITRRQSKDLTLGRFYGMGPGKLAAKLGCGVEEAKELLAKFDQSVPFVKEMADLCSNRASSRGYLRTLCGRRRHFNWWEPADAYERRRDNPDQDLNPRKRDAAELKWPKVQLKRAHTHKSLNSLIQGSAADMTKAFMVAQYEETGNVPYLAIHDETDSGVDDQEQADEIQKIAESCVDLQIPIRADMSLGDHWK